MQKKITALVALGIGIGAGCFMASSGGAEEIGDPIEFHPGEVARSADVNSNFTKVYDQVNKIGRAVTVDEANSKLDVADNLDVGGNTHVGGDLDVTGKVNGDVNAADLTVSGTLKITGSNPGGGKVLVSDADGTATWQMLNGIPVVTSAGGRIWMAKDLGAMRVATKINDAEAYGWLFAYGGLADGHQYRNTPTDTINKGEGFWDATNTGGANNPCPAGFRIPTKDEWDIEVASWSSQDAAGALASPLKLSLSGYITPAGSPIQSLGEYGGWWSCTTYYVGAHMKQYTHYVYVTNSDGGVFAHTGYNPRIPNITHSVRCIQHQ